MYDHYPYIDRSRITWPNGARVASWMAANIEFYELHAPTNPVRSPWARTLMLLLACAVLPSPAVAQSDDAAYCAQLGNLALRYTGSAGGNGGLRPDFTTLGAIDDCNKGNTAAGIPVLEKKLRSNGFTLPRR